MLQIQTTIEEDLAPIHQAAARLRVELGIPARVFVFRLNHWDWWAGYDLQSVKAAYARSRDFDLAVDSAAGLFHDPHPLTEAELAATRFFHDLAAPSESEVVSFRDRLDELINENTEFPCFFATTEA
jgi:hypothetical protein